MKTMFLILGLSLTISLSSCTRDWTCRCVNNNGYVEYHEIPSATLRDADNTCESFQYNDAFGYNNCALMVE